MNAPELTHLPPELVVVLNSVFRDTHHSDGLADGAKLAEVVLCVDLGLLTFVHPDRGAEHLELTDAGFSAVGSAGKMLAGPSQRALLAQYEATLV